MTRFSWNIAAAASALTALILLFPIFGTTDCDEGARGCTTVHESLLVRYQIGYAVAVAIAVGIAALVGVVIYAIGQRVSGASRRGTR